MSDKIAGEKTIDNAKNYNSNYVPFAADKPVVKIN